MHNYLTLPCSIVSASWYWQLVWTSLCTTVCIYWLVLIVECNNWVNNWVFTFQCMMLHKFCVFISYYYWIAKKELIYFHVVQMVENNETESLHQCVFIYVCNIYLDNLYSAFSVPHKAVHAWLCDWPNQMLFKTVWECFLHKATACYN